MKNKKIILAVLAVVIVGFSISGTIAWLTRVSEITNTFTVGTFSVPTTDPITQEEIEIDGNLYEPSWDSKADHKLLPGALFEKDPYVGMGPGSEDAVVYVKVENNISEKVYFELNENWTAVDEYSEKYEVAQLSEENNKYVYGLFKYTGNNGILSASDADSWTNPLFDEIIVADDANIDDFSVNEGEGRIIVKSFLHQAKDSKGSSIPEEDILETVTNEFYPEEPVNN